MKPRAIVLLAALTGLCSLAGCAGPYSAVPPAPLIVKPVVCPAPAPPALPHLDAALMLDELPSALQLLERDDLMRGYIEGLRAAISCYESQSAGKAKE